MVAQTFTVARAVLPLGNDRIQHCSLAIALLSWSADLANDFVSSCARGIFVALPQDRVSLFHSDVILPRKHRIAVGDGKGLSTENLGQVGAGSKTVKPA